MKDLSDYRVLYYYWYGDECKVLLEKSVCLPYYRVSIKSFPDHRHLLQEIYVEYIFFFKM